MKAIILAAGRGSRMGTLTDEVPKPLIEWNGKPLLHHKLDILPECIDSVCLIVGYKADAVIARLGDSYNRESGSPISLTYVRQDDPRGTMDALERARDHIGHDHVIVMMGDDIYDAADINSLCEDARNSRWSMLFHSGLDDSFTYTGGCVINERIFDIPAVPIKDGSETGLPQTLAAASIKFDIPVQMRLTRTWRKMNKPEDLAN